MARIARCNTPSPNIPARDAWASQQIAVFELHMLNFNLPNNYTGITVNKGMLSSDHY
jgi:hypothetical protein